jgi:hypothetical protein
MSILDDEDMKKAGLYSEQTLRERYTAAKDEREKMKSEIKAKK